MRKIYKMIIPMLILAFNVCLVLFPRDVLDSAREGLLLWFNRVLPSLLPFAAGVGIMTELGLTEKLGGVFSPVMRPLFNLPGAAGVAVLTGLTSGYPMGAKAAADLYDNGLLSREQTQRLAGFCNNAGPLFIIGVVGTALFNDTSAGYKLWFAHVISALIIGIVLGISARLKKKRNSGINEEAVKINKEKNSARDEKSFGAALRDTIENVMEAMFMVGGLIILFSVLTRILTVLGLIGGMAGGLFEMTNGVYAVAEAAGLDTRLKMMLTAGIISFGGLSVHAQSMSVLSKKEIKGGPYIICKIIHGLLAAALFLF